MIKIVDKSFEIHCTPLERVEVEAGTIIVYLDNINEERFKLVFNVCQGLKVTASDCVSYSSFKNDFCFSDGIYHRYILEVEDSGWVRQLKKDLTDRDATFLERSRHFILPLQDVVIEILAYEIEIVKI